MLLRRSMAMPAESLELCRRRCYSASVLAKRCCLKVPVDNLKREIEELTHPC